MIVDKGKKSFLRVRCFQLCKIAIQSKYVPRMTGKLIHSLGLPDAHIRYYKPRNRNQNLITTSQNGINHKSETKEFEEQNTRNNCY